MTEAKPTKGIFEGGNGKDGVEYEKKVRSDGSYVELITDYAKNRVEIREYDADGNFVSSAHFRL